MQGVPDSFDHSFDQADYKVVPQHPGVELFRAHIVRHAFEPHTHQAFGLGVIEAGVERFRYRGAEHLAPPQSLVLMNPDELHTGRAETVGGWRYRMLYIERETLERVTGERGWWFKEAVTQCAQSGPRVATVLRQLWAADEPLAFDGLLHELLGHLRLHACVPSPAQTNTALRFAPVLDFMRAHLHRSLSLAELAAVMDLSPWHFLRCFKAQHHVTPQQMLMALRLFEAKRLLATGLAPAQVAVDVGLADQAHLNRAFTRRYGTTPGRYQMQTRVPAKTKLTQQDRTRRPPGAQSHLGHVFPNGAA